MRNLSRSEHFTASEPRSRASSTRRSLAAIAAFPIILGTILAQACAEPVCILGCGPCSNGGNPDPQTGECPGLFPGTSTTGTSDTEDGADETGALFDVGNPDPPAYGEKWCVRAIGAEYTPDPDPDPLQDPEVLYEDDTAPEGCACVPYLTDVQNWLEMNQVAGEATIEQTALEVQLGVGDPLIADLLALREDIYTEAVAECADIAPLPNQGTTCNDPAIFDVDPVTPALEPRPIYLGDRFGEIECLPDPQGVAPSCTFADDVSQLDYRGGTYYLPQDILNGFLGAPYCILLQGWAIQTALDGAFYLDGIVAGDMLDTLGLQNGDEFLAVTAGGQTYDLTDFWEALEAYQELVNEDQFMVVVSRRSVTVTLTYVVS